MRRFKLLVYFSCRMLGLFRLARWLTRDRLRILCYHGFALEDEADFRPKLFLGEATFRTRLATLHRQRWRVLPLDEAVRLLYARSLPRDSVVITVDDGFHSVYRLALPCLARYGYPATVYVTSYYVDKGTPIFRLVVQYMFWKTRLERLVLEDVPWAAPGTVNLADPAAKERAMWACIGYGERQGAEEARVAISEALGRLLGVPYPEIVRSRMLHLMTPEELRALPAARVGVELHTHRHAFPSDDPARAAREIADNREALRQWLATEPRHFCYPSGLWAKRQWAWLEEMDVASATTCLPGLNSHETPRHALRRFLDGADVHALEFEAELSGFADLLRALRGRRGGIEGVGAEAAPPSYRAGDAAM